MVDVISFTFVKAFLLKLMKYERYSYVHVLMLPTVIWTHEVVGSG
jgi:hypothetical protein